MFYPLMFQVSKEGRVEDMRGEFLGHVRIIGTFTIQLFGTKEVPCENLIFQDLEGAEHPAWRHHSPNDNYSINLYSPEGKSTLF